MWGGLLQPPGQAAPSPSPSAGRWRQPRTPQLGPPAEPPFATMQGRFPLPPPAHPFREKPQVQGRVWGSWRHEGAEEEQWAQSGRAPLCYRHRNGGAPRPPPRHHGASQRDGAAWPGCGICSRLAALRERKTRNTSSESIALNFSCVYFIYLFFICAQALRGKRHSLGWKMTAEPEPRGLCSPPSAAGLTRRSQLSSFLWLFVSREHLFFLLLFCIACEDVCFLHKILLEETEDVTQLHVLKLAAFRRAASC